jgi:hypothetical protein
LLSSMAHVCSLLLLLNIKWLLPLSEDLELMLCLILFANQFSMKPISVTLNLILETSESYPWWWGILWPKFKSTSRLEAEGYDRFGQHKEGGELMWLSYLFLIQTKTALLRHTSMHHNSLNLEFGIRNQPRRIQNERSRHEHRIYLDNLVIIDGWMSKIPTPRWCSVLTV